MLLGSAYGHWSTQSGVIAVCTSSVHVHAGGRFRQRDDAAATEHALVLIVSWLICGMIQGSADYHECYESVVVIWFWSGPHIDPLSVCEHPDGCSGLLSGLWNGSLQQRVRDTAADGDADPMCRTSGVKHCYLSLIHI